MREWRRNWERQGGGRDGTKPTLCVCNVSPRFPMGGEGMQLSICL